MEEKKIAQKSPCVLEMEPGKYWFCTCGHSTNQPFCDGAHKVTTYTPLEVEITEKQKVAWCACKHSGKTTFCDGTHRTL